MAIFSLSLIFHLDLFWYFKGIQRWRKLLCLSFHELRLLTKLFSFDSSLCCRKHYSLFVSYKNIYFQAFRKSKYFRQCSFSLHVKAKAHNEKNFLKKKVKTVHFNTFKHTVLELKLSSYCGWLFGHSFMFQKIHYKKCSRKDTAYRLVYRQIIYR